MIVHVVQCPRILCIFLRLTIIISAPQKCTISKFSKATHFWNQEHLSHFLEQMHHFMFFRLFKTKTPKSWQALYTLTSVVVTLTFAVKFVTANWNFSLVFAPATLPAFATLLKAPFSHAAPAVTYLCTHTNKLSNVHGKHPWDRTYKWKKKEKAEGFIDWYDAQNLKNKILYHTIPTVALPYLCGICVSSILIRKFKVVWGI